MEPVRSRLSRTKWALGVAYAAAVAFAPLPLACHWFDGPWLAAVVLLFAAAYIAWWPAHHAAHRRGVHPAAAVSDRLVPFAVMAPIGLLATGCWLNASPAVAHQRLGPATTYGGLLLFSATFGPVRSFFTQLVRLEESEVDEQGKRLRRDAQNKLVIVQDKLRMQAGMFVLAALVGGLGLLLAALPPLGLDRVTHGVPEGWLEMSIGAAACCLLIVAACVAARSSPPNRTVSCSLALPSGVLAGIVLASLALGAGAGWAMLSTPAHLPYLGWVFGITFALLIADTCGWSLSWLPMIPTGGRRVVLLLSTGMAAGLAVGWLVSHGLFSERGPVDAIRTLEALVLCSVPVGALAVGGGMLVWRYTSAPQKSMHRMSQSLLPDVGMYGLLLVVAVTVPVAVVARLDAAGVAHRGLAGVAPAFSAAGVVVAFYFFTSINLGTPGREERRPPPPEFAALYSDRTLVKANARRIRRFRWRVRIATVLTTVVLVTGATALLARLS